MSVASALASLDAPWLSEVLQTEVAAVEIEPVAFTGATTDMARIRIMYATGGSGPASMIAKIRGVTDVQRQMDGAMGLFEREVRFYETFADQVPVNTPACYYAGDGDSTPLLLEDLGAVRMGDQMDGMTLADAEATMDALADLHAAYWESEKLSEPWLASPGEGMIAAMITQLVSSGAPALAERYSGRGLDGVLDKVVEYAPAWGEKVLARCADGPQTLVHNDARMDNLFFGEDGKPVFIDWQILARTRGTQDVGNLLAGSMDSGDLAQHWETLLRRYHDRLVAGGVSGYSFDQCVEHYRVNVIYPLGAGMALIGMMDIGDGRGLGDAICMRCLKHIADMDSFAAL
jgi:hypothetical protein